MTASALPAAIGRFRIEAEIGRGAMGIVYRAHDPVMDRPVAVKVIHLAFEASEEERAEFEARFLTEARVIARLTHPGIVVAYDAGLTREHGPPYIALEYLTGRTLADVLAEKRPDWRESLRLVSRLARALHYAHAQGVVHRDIKPANVMVLPGGEPKLMDFGLARFCSALAKHVTGPVVGTPLYMSPEQVLGGAVDARSDLFALGCVAYALLTGRRAFDAEGLTRILHRVVHEDPAPPTRLVRGLPSAADYLIARSLSKRPEDRYANGGAMADDYEDVLAARRPRHRAGWKPWPASGEATVDSPERILAAPAPAAGAKAALAGAPAPAAPPARDDTASLAVGPRPQAGRPGLGLLMLTLLALGATLYVSPFWRQQLAGVLGASPPVLGTWRPVLPPASPSPVPVAQAGAEPAADAPALADPPSASLPSDAGHEPTASPGAPDPSVAAAGTEPDDEDPVGDDADAAASEPAGEPAPSSEASPVSAAPAPASKPAVRKPPAQPRANARLRISITHELKSGRLKVMVDGRTVIDQALRAQKKRHLVFFNRRQGRVESRLPVVPGRRRIRVEVQAGSRTHAEELRETFTAGKTRQLNLRVLSGDRLAFDWE